MATGGVVEPPGRAVTASRYTPSTDRPAVLDVGARRRDVARIARRHGPLWRACLRLGWEAADLEQEVLLRILQRQRGASAYDPERSGIGKYLWMATKSALGHVREQAEAEMRGGRGGRREQAMAEVPDSEDAGPSEVRWQDASLQVVGADAVVRFGRGLPYLELLTPSGDVVQVRLGIGPVR